MEHWRGRQIDEIFVNIALFLFFSFCVQWVLKIFYLSVCSKRVNLSYRVSQLQGNNPSSTLNVRIPSWTSRSGAKAALNAQSLDLTNPGKFGPFFDMYLFLLCRSHFLP